MHVYICTGKARHQTRWYSLPCPSGPHRPFPSQTYTPRQRKACLHTRTQHNIHVQTCKFANIYVHTFMNLTNLWIWECICTQTCEFENLYFHTNIWIWEWPHPHIAIAKWRLACIHVQTNEFENLNVCKTYEFENLHTWNNKSYEFQNFFIYKVYVCPSSQHRLCLWRPCIHVCSNIYTYMYSLWINVHKYVYKDMYIHICI